MIGIKNTTKAPNKRVYFYDANIQNSKISVKSFFLIIAIVSESHCLLVGKCMTLLLIRYNIFFKNLEPLFYICNNRIL